MDLKESSPQMKPKWSNPIIRYMTTLYPLPSPSTKRLMWNFCSLYSRFPTQEGELPDRTTPQTCKPFPDSHLSLRERDTPHLHYRQRHGEPPLTHSPEDSCRCWKYSSTHGSPTGLALPPPAAAAPTMPCHLLARQWLTPYWL